MDRKILTSVLYPFLFLGLASCEKDAEIPVPVENPKLVVYSYITPSDTTIYVSVSSSDPIFDSNTNGSNTITNATVTIQHLGTTYTLPYNATNGLYSISTTTLPVVSGHSYTLSVSAPGYETVSGSTTVPQQNNFNLTTTYTGSSAPNSQNYTPKKFRFICSWNHFNAGDYYRLCPTFYSLTTSPPGIDTSFQTYTSFFYSKEDAVAGVIADNIEVPSGIFEDSYPFYHGYKMDLIISGFDYYKFHESLSNYTEGDPFAEPTLIYTNITNGYGIFAGYLRYKNQINF